MRVSGLTLCVGMALPAAAQPPSFEVTSVRLNASRDFRNIDVKTFPGGRFTARDVPVLVLLTTAYNLPVNPSERLSGVPDWAISERYDIEATAPSGSFPSGMPNRQARAKMQAMIRSLLADRFKLVMRRETRQLPLYELTVAKSGPKLAKAAIEEEDCPIGPTSGAACHSFSGGIGRGLHAKAVDMKDLARYIENWTDLPIIDTTGLDGLFAIETEGWMPMSLPPPPPPNMTATPAPRPSGDEGITDPARPTLFMVLQKLGLDLKRKRGPVDVYVVEHIERPAPN